LTGRLNPPPGALFKAVLAGADDDWYLFATDSGYGFITQLKELHTKNRAGKALLTVPEHAKVLTPVRVEQPESDLVAIATAQGRLLVFPVSEIPILNKGKGNKLIQIQPADLAARQDYVVAMIALSLAAGLKVHSGKRSLGLSAEDLVHYRGTRARRGNPLPKGFQRVSGLEKIS
jgi:topoisomerase-4 subunit A